MGCYRLADLPPPASSATGWPWTEEAPELPGAMADCRPWPRITVVTPSYNQAAFLEETVRSVLLQGYPNLEYLVLDGGSTDGSVAILERYSPWIDWWTSERDAGQSDAIQRGLDRATGEIFNWINSDDALLPGGLGTVARCWGEADLVAAGGIAWIPTDLTGASEPGADRVRSPPERLWHGGSSSRGYGSGGRSCSPSGASTRAFSSFFDKELLARYLVRYPEVGYTAQPVAVFRQHPAAKTSKPARRLRHRVRAGPEEPRRCRCRAAGQGGVRPPACPARPPPGHGGGRGVAALAADQGGAHARREPPERPAGPRAYRRGVGARNATRRAVPGA